MDTTNTPCGEADARAAGNSELDLSGVDPLRLVEIRRRVAVVKSYLQIKAPNEADRRKHAFELDLSVNQFLALVRAWSQQQKASAISGAGTAKGSPRPGGRRALPTASKATARQVIGEADTNSSLVEIVRLVRQRCEAIGVSPPSRSTIWNMVMEARRNDPGTEDRGTLVSRCHVRLPVKIDAEIEFPMLTLALDRGSGAIVLAALDDALSLAPYLADAVEAGTIAEPVTVDEELTERIQTMKVTSLKRVPATAARTETARILGRGVGSLDLIYQHSRARRPEDMLRSRKDAALSEEDAARIIVEQLDAHNAARSAKPPIVPQRLQPADNRSRNRKRFDGGRDASSTRSISSSNRES